MRCSSGRAFLIVGICYGLLWALTAILGPESVRGKFCADHATGFGWSTEGRVPSKCLDYVNVREPRTDGPTISFPDSGPWHYIGSAWSPGPFLVVADFAYLDAPLGGAGGRVYVLWLFGPQVSIWHDIYWVS